MHAGTVSPHQFLENLLRLRRLVPDALIDRRTLVRSVRLQQRSNRLPDPDGARTGFDRDYYF